MLSNAHEVSRRSRRPASIMARCHVKQSKDNHDQDVARACLDAAMLETHSRSLREGNFFSTQQQVADERTGRFRRELVGKEEDRLVSSSWRLVHENIVSQCACPLMVIWCSGNISRCGRRNDPTCPQFDPGYRQYFLTNARTRQVPFAVQGSLNNSTCFSVWMSVICDRTVGVTASSRGECVIYIA